MTRLLCTLAAISVLAFGSVASAQDGFVYDSSNPGYDEIPSDSLGDVISPPPQTGQMDNVPDEAIYGG